MGSLAEPALILVFFTVPAVSASNNPYLMNHALAGSPYVIVLPTHLLGLVTFFLLILWRTAGSRSTTRPARSRSRGNRRLPVSTSSTLPVNASATSSQLVARWLTSASNG